MPAIGRAVAWSRAMRETQARPATAPQPAASAECPEGERALLQALGRCGMPVIPQALARNAQEAATAAAACGCPAARKAPGASIDVVVVSPMRAPGVELLVSVRSAPLWGPVLALGLGGVWVEILKDTQLRLRPATEDDVLDMLGRLKGRALLDGYRSWTRWRSTRCAQARTARKRWRLWPCGKTDHNYQKNSFNRLPVKRFRTFYGEALISPSPRPARAPARSSPPAAPPVLPVATGRSRPPAAVRAAPAAAAVRTGVRSRR